MRGPLLVRSTPLTRVNPVAKIAVLLFLTAGVLLSVDLVSAAIVFAAICLAFPLTGVSLSRVLATLWIIPITALMTAWATVLMAEPAGPVLTALGPISITQGPLLAGVALFVRSLDLMLPCVLLALSMDSTELADSLVQLLRLPERFVLAALAATRLIGVLSEDLENLQFARRARGISRSGPLGAVLDFFPVAGALLVESVRKGGRLAMAMEGRAFGAAGRTWSRTVILRPRDWAAVAVSALISTVAIAAAIATGSWNPIFS